MTIRVLSLAFAVWIGLGFAAESAQVLVSVGNSRAYNCYFAAKSGFASDDMIKLCSSSLDEENLSLQDRAATYDNRGTMGEQSWPTRSGPFEFRCRHRDRCVAWRCLCQSRIGF